MGNTFGKKFKITTFGESHGKLCYEYLFKLNSPCENCGINSAPRKRAAKTLTANSKTIDDRTTPRRFSTHARAGPYLSCVESKIRENSVRPGRMSTLPTFPSARMT